MCSVMTLFRRIPSVIAVSRRPAPGCWLSVHISSFPSFQCAVAPCGPSGAWLMKGYVYARFHYLRGILFKAASGIAISFFIILCGACLLTSSARWAYATLL